MKGLIFNLLEDAVSDEYGADTWDEFLLSAGVEGSYTSLGSYPDEQFNLLLRSTAVHLGKSSEDVLRWFGISAIPRLADRYPVFFEPHANTRSFLLTLNDIIHAEVRKLYPDAMVPSFRFDTSVPDCLLMTYSSKRQLCSLAEGFVLGAAGYYQESIDFEHTKCARRGDAECSFRIEFK